VSQNTFLRTRDFHIGQSNTGFYIGRGSNQPFFEYNRASCNIVFHSNVLASNVQGTFQRLTALQTLYSPTTLTSNLTVAYNPLTGSTPTLVVKNADSNLFVVNGYNNGSYFAGRLGVGTTTLTTSAYLQSPTANLNALTIDTLGFNATPGIYMSNVLGSIHLTRPTVFEANVDIVGALSAASFDIADLSTNRGVFHSNVLINDYLSILHSSNNAPTVSLRRNYLSSNASMFSNVPALYPILTATLTTNSNTDTLTTPILLIDPTGKLGIGTTTPSKTIDIYQGNTFANTVSNTGLIGIHGVYSTDFIAINSNAFIGIGTDTPQCYLDMMIPSCNVFSSNQATGFLYIHSNATPILFMDSNGHIGINTTTTRSNAAIYVDGVLECEYLSTHRFTTPGDTPIINFSGCNIGNINTIGASNIDINIIRGCNIYCDLISASNYDLLAFNSYLSTQEIELELDDLIYSGNNAFIVAKNYPLYFDVIGASNAQGGLDGTTDPTLANKPTDHVIHASFGRIHVVSDESCNLVLLNDGRRYNNAVVATASNQFNGVSCNVSVFMHTMGSNGAGYSFGLTRPTTTVNDSLCRISLDPYPYDDVPAATYGYDTFTMAMEPYGGSARRIGLRYNYTQNTLQASKVYVSGTDVSTTITAAELNSMSGYTLYSRGNIKVDATGGAATIYSARYAGGDLTFAIGSSISGPNGYYLDVNGRAIIRNDMQVVGKIYANSVISQTSDRRLKDNLKVIESPLEKIKTLTGYTFDRIDQGAPPQRHREAGLIAQDVRAILPEVVHENHEGYYSIAYGNLAGLFVESIKALECRCAALESHIATLETELKTLHSL
jgi:hypothetical protein